MLVTLSEIVTLVSFVQLKNAKSPMLVTPDGIVKEPVFPSGQQINVVWDLSYNTPDKLE